MAPSQQRHFLYFNPLSAKIQRGIFISLPASNYTKCTFYFRKYTMQIAVFEILTLIYFLVILFKFLALKG